MTTIGLLSPNLDPGKLADARRILPDDIELRGHSFVVRKYVDREFERSFDEILDERDLLGGQDYDLVMLTGELFLAHAGPEACARLVGRIGRKGCRVATIVDAIAAAFDAMSVSRVVLASPFSETQTGRLKNFLGGHGVEVVGHACLGYADSDTIWNLDPRCGYDLAADLAARYPLAEAIYMPNNQWRITSIINELEQRFGKPVIANTPAWIRHALATLGIKRRIAGYGALLEN